MIQLFGSGSVRHFSSAKMKTGTNWYVAIVPSGNTMQVFAGHTGPVNCGEFTPDG